MEFLRRLSLGGILEKKRQQDNFKLKQYGIDRPND